METVPIHFYLQHLKLYCLFLGNACKISRISNVAWRGVTCSTRLAAIEPLFQNHFVDTSTDKSSFLKKPFN